MLNKIKLAALCVVFVGPTGAGVAQAADGQYYFGFDLGQAEARKYCRRLSNCDNADSSFRGAFGYQFNKIVSAELGFTSFGTLFEANSTTVSAEQEANAWTASAVGTWPVANRVGAFVRAGLARYNVKNTGTVGGVPVEDENSTKPYFGGGVTYDLSTNWMLRGEYQVYTNISGVDGSEDNIQAWSAGAAYRF